MNTKNVLLGALVILTLIFASLALAQQGEVNTSTETTTVTSTATTTTTSTTTLGPPSTGTTTTTSSPPTTSTSTQTKTQTTTTFTTPTTVTVFGLASTVGEGTHVVSLTFTNTGTGANYTAPMSNGGFSVDLPNGAVYHVSVQWAGNYSWQAGVEDRGDLTVNMSAGSMMAQSYNVQFETPPTAVAVHGTILWTLPLAYPYKIVYTASDGESFDATVQNATFSTRLPNLMDYHVTVFWQYADGSTDYLVGTNQIVSEGVGVAGLDLVVMGA